MRVSTRVDKVVHAKLPANPVDISMYANVPYNRRDYVAERLNQSAGFFDHLNPLIACQVETEPVKFLATFLFRLPEILGA